MLLRKVMTRLGKGNTKIDLVLEKGLYCAGEMVKGSFLLRGGIIEQHIKRIDCDLIMHHVDKEQETIIETVTILTSRKIRANQDEHVPFSLMLPDEIETSSKSLQYYFKTKLVFDEGIESKDQDVIYIK